MITEIKHDTCRIILGFTIFCCVAFVFNHGLARGDWLPEEQLSRDVNFSTTSSSNQCDIALDASGNIHVVWLDNRDHIGSIYEVYYKKYDSSRERWELDTQLTFDVVTGYDPQHGTIVESQNKASPGIVADSEGNLYVSFENTETQTACYVWYEDSTSTWYLSPEELGTGRISDINPGMAADSSDNLHAVWRGLDAGHPQIFYRRYTPDSGWGSTEQLTTADSDKKTPALTIDPSGHIHVVWADDRDSGGLGLFEIFYTKKPPEGDWEAETCRSSAPAFNSLKPYIVSDASGNLHLVWEDDRDGNFEIYYCLWTESSGWGLEERLTFESSPSENPHLTVDPSGQVHLIWQDGRYLGGGIHPYSLYYKKKTSFWGDDIRLSRRGCRGSIISDTESNLHTVYTAQFESVGNPEIYYLKFDPTAAAPPSPNEVVLVLDASGSMSWREDGTVPADPRESRLYKAGQALSNFLDRYNLRNPTDAYFGLVTFPHSSEICPSAENVIPGTGPLFPLNDTTRLNAIKDIIPGLTAGGMTPMAEGLTLAKGMLNSADVNKILLLVSDGYHNCPSRSFPADILTSFIDPVYTVGIGTAVEVDLPLLEDIAAATGGEFCDATTASPLDLMEWMKTYILSFLGIEAECDPSGEIRTGQKIRHETWITEFDTNIAFGLSWSTPAEGCIDFSLHTPDGKTITPEKAHLLSGVTHISRETYQIYYLEEEYLKDIKRPGQWTLELLGKKIEQEAVEPYNYSVLMDSTLKMIPEFNHKSYRTGDPVGLQVVVLEKRKRLPAKVRAVIHSPRESLGNWLAKNPLNPEALKKKPEVKGGDLLSDMHRKALILTEDGQKPFLDSPGEQILVLYDDGTHGDLTANDGIYANLFTNTKVPGTYTFNITMEGKTSSGQKFRRQRVVQRYIEVNVAEEFTDMKMERLDSDLPDVLECRATITPKDALGNFLGPGHGDRISFFMKRATFEEPLQDNLDGSYSQRFCIPVSLAEKRNIIQVHVLGVEMAFCF